MLAEKIGFTFDGTAGTNESGRPKNESWSNGTLTISYDAASDSFTLTASDLTQTLKLGQPTTTANGGTALLNFYPGAGGTSYVRMAEWSNMVPQSGTTDFRYSWFAFGMPTPNDAIVRTGTAGFAVDVRGIASDEDNANAMRFSGSGTLLLDLAAGQLRGLIPLSFTENYTGGKRTAASDQGDLLIQARLGSANGSLYGTADVWGGIGAYYGLVTRGALYGPSAQEIGGDFTAKSYDQNNFSQLVGSFAGSRQSGVVDPDTQIKRLADLPGPTVLGFERVVKNASQFPDLPLGANRIEYDPTTGTYRVTFPDMRQLVSSSGGVDNYLVSTGGTAVFSAATKDATQPLTGFDAHTATIGTQTYRALLLRPDNPQVQLSYVSLAGFAVENRNSAAPGSFGPGNEFRSYAYFGNRSVSVPTTGTASYTGVVLADGVVVRRIDAATLYGDTYDVTGRATMSVNFGSQTFSATLDQLVGTRRYLSPNSDPSAANFNFPSLTESGLLGYGASFQAQTTSGYDRFFGSFFGPKAAEFALFFEKQFGTSGTDPLAWHLVGVAAGKKN